MANAVNEHDNSMGPAARSGPNKAVLYRMVMDKHICPFGLKSRDLLKREGFEIEDNHLTTREETDAFMEEHGVETTPQTWIGDERIGGYDDLRVYFGIDAPEDAPERQAANSGTRPVERIPLRRAGAPEDIADAVAAICGHDMRYVTGQTIHATGGFYMG